MISLIGLYKIFLNNSIILICLGPMMLPDATLALTAALVILQLAHTELWDVHFLFAYLRDMNRAQTAVFNPILASYLNAI